MKKVERLKLEIAAYQANADAATRGSTQQIVAIEKVAVAQQRLARITGETALKTDAMAASSAHAERDIGKATRGALASTGVFSGMGRSLAFASGGFLAFAGVGDILTKSVEAARGQEVVQRQLAAQIKASGSSIALYGKQIDQADLSLAKFGFTSDDAESALTFLVRATGNVTTALRINTVAAEVARATGRTLTESALLLGKAYDGQTTGLKRLGVELPKGVKGMEAINITAQKFAGQAKAGTTEAEKFGATLHDSEVIIGQQLLPVLNKYLAKGATWLDQMNRSGRLQKDVKTGIHDVGDAIQATEAILGPFVTMFKDFGKAVGGTKNELELLGLAFITLEARAKLIKWGLISTGVKTVGAEAVVAEGEVTALAGSLTALGGMAPIVIPITVAIAGMAGLRALEKWAGKGISASFSPSGGGTAQGSTPVPTLNNPSTWSPAELAAVAAQRGPETAAYYLQHPAAAMAVVQAFKKRSGGRITPGVLTGTSTASGGAGAAGTSPPHDLPLGGGAVSPFSATPFTAHQQLTNALTANPNNLTLLGRQVAYDKAALASAARQRADGRIDNKRYQQEYANYMGDLVSTQATITSITQAAASKVAAEKKKQADAIKRVSVPGSLSGSEKTIKAMLGKQHESPEQYVAGAEKPGHFERLGPLRASSYNIPLGLQLASARDTAMNDQGGLLTIAHLEVAAARRALKSGKLGIQGQIDAWNVIDQANQQLGASMLHSYIAPSAAKLVAGLGLHGTAKRMAEARFADIEAHGGRMARAGATGVLGTVVITGPGIHVHGVKDIRGLTKELQKAGNRTSSGDPWRRSQAPSLGLH